MKSVNLSIDEFEDWITKNEDLFSSLNYANEWEAIAARIKNFEAEISEIKANNISDNSFSKSAYKSPKKKEGNLFNNPHDYAFFGQKHQIDLSEVSSKVNSANNSKDFSDNSRNAKIAELSKNSGRNSTKGKKSSNKLELRIERLQSELATKVQNESDLESENQKLKSELDGLKNLMKNDKYYQEIKGTISNISQAIFNSSVKCSIEDQHQSIYSQSSKSWK